jgi:hypothetical protein
MKTLTTPLMPHCLRDRRHVWGHCGSQPITECGEQAGLGNFAGHSLRAGFATTAAHACRSETAIMRHGRWKSVQVARRYIPEQKKEQKLHGLLSVGRARAETAAGVQTDALRTSRISIVAIGSYGHRDL